MNDADVAGLAMGWMSAILSRQSFERNSIVIFLRFMQNRGAGEIRNTDTGKNTRNQRFL